MPERLGDPRLPPGHYYYRRRLRAAELLAPTALGAAAGLVVFYLARLLRQRTPLSGGESGVHSHQSRGDPAIARRRA